VSRYFTVAVFACVVVGTLISLSVMADIQPRPAGENDGNTIWARELTEQETWKIFLFQYGLSEGLSYKDILLLVRISKAESSFNHYDKDGSVLKGKINPSDVGLFQINEKYHLEKSKELGLDIYNPIDNIKYAVYLYKKNGTKDWLWSKKIWSKN
jgi:hypothetical protein